MTFYINYVIIVSNLKGELALNNLWKRLWAEIDLDNLLHNFGIIKQHVGADAKICCVVKADAYGHNAPTITRILEKAGADMFAVSNLEEALQLRRTGITIPVLILGYTPAECVDVLIENAITQCVYSSEYAQLLVENITVHKAPLNVHIKIDTGMGRLGFQYDDELSAVSQILDVSALEGLNIEGIFTHFAISDEGDSGKAFTYGQFEKFCKIVDALEKKGLSLKYKHCSNSAGAIAYPDFSMNMVRAGLILYGLLPSDKLPLAHMLKPVMSLKSVISNLKTINRGDTVSYGCEFVADKTTRIATIPMGYADGFYRSNFKNGSTLIVKGTEARIVGRICMDQLMIDVTDIDDLKIGDEVVVFGDRECTITADDLARTNGTINYEIICSIGKRVPRVFILNGKIEHVYSALLDSPIN